MIKLENTDVIGWEHAIRGMRNPKNSWEKMDSFYCFGPPPPDDAMVNLCKGCRFYKSEECENATFCPYVIGPNDHELMMKLAKGGSVHAKYRRMIVVYVDITAPLYWWKEFDTYKVGTVANSCSTMHKIADKEFTLEDFSCEHLFDDIFDSDNLIEVCDGGDTTALGVLENTIQALNFYRNKYLEAKTKPMKDESERAGIMKKYWWQMIQLLPSSYNQKRTVMLNYEVLAGMYKHRNTHLLDEWPAFCKWIEKLPYSEIITLAE